MASLQRFASITMIGCSALLLAAPAAAANAAPRTPPQTMKKAEGSPLKIELPGLGGRKVRLEYSGPIAPWKVLNPLHKGEREGRITFFGAKKPKGQTVHTVAVSAAHETGVRRGGLSVASTHAGEGSSATKSFEVGASAESQNGSTTMAQHVAYRARQSSGDGTESALTVSGRMETAHGEHAPKSATHEVNAESFSRRPSATGGFDHAKRSASARSQRVGEQVTHEAVAFSSEIASNGEFKEQGLSLHVGERPAQSSERAVVAKAGRVTGKHGAIETGDGVIVKRATNGDVSAKLVDGGQRRTRAMTLGDETNHQSLPERLRDGIVGNRQPAAATFANGIPVTD